MKGPLNTAFSLSFTFAMSEAAVASSLLDPTGDTTRKLARFWGTRLCRACGVEIATVGGEGVAWSEPLTMSIIRACSYTGPASLPFRAVRNVGQAGAIPPADLQRGHARLALHSHRPGQRAAKLSFRQAAGSDSSQLDRRLSRGTRSVDGSLQGQDGAVLLGGNGPRRSPVGIRGTASALPKDTSPAGGLRRSAHGHPISPSDGDRGGDRPPWCGPRRGTVSATCDPPSARRVDGRTRSLLERPAV